MTDKVCIGQHFASTRGSEISYRVLDWHWVTITVAHAEALLKATPLEQRTDMKPAEREKKTAPIEQIEKLQKEMDQVQESYTQAEENYGSDLPNLVVAKGYLTKLLANEAVKSYGTIFKFLQNIPSTFPTTALAELDTAWR